MREHFSFYGYNPPDSGIYEIGGVQYFSGEDFRSVKRYKEYKNVGFDVLLLQHACSYNGEDFDTSVCKMCMERAYSAGIGKIIVSDNRLKDLCVEENLVGENGRFKNEAALVEYAAACIAPYRRQKGFYGVQLFDEPTFDKIESYGKVCRALKKVMPEIYLQCNLFPATGVDYLSDCEDKSFAYYEKYIDNFAEKSGEDNICFDEYPFLREYLLGVYSLRTYQTVAKVCAKRNLELRAVMQSFSYFHKDHLIHRRVTERDMYWLMNMALGFGCKEFSFFTYFTKPKVHLIGGEKFEEEGKLPIHLTGAPSGDSVDGAAFINRDGSRTKLYYFTKRIISEFKNFEPHIINRRFKQSYLFFEKGKSAKDFLQTKHAEYNTGCTITVNPSCGVVLVTELTGDGSTMYMVENFSNVKDEFFGKQVMKAEIFLGEKAMGAEYYFRGKRIERTVKNGGFTETLRTGDAIFIVVKK